MPQDVWDDLTKNNPHNAIQTMSNTDPTVNRLASSAQTSTTENYKADLIKMREDLSQLFRKELSQLGLAPSKICLYQRLYPDAFDLVPYPTGWRVPDFIKFSGDDNRSTWEHISQYVAQLGEASSSNALCVRLFSLSLTGTVFSWFSSLPPNSVRSWNELEQKFHDHFYSGDNEAKLTDLTSVKQTRDKSVSDYSRDLNKLKTDALICQFLIRIW